MSDKPSPEQIRMTSYWIEEGKYYNIADEVLEAFPNLKKAIENMNHAEHVLKLVADDIVSNVNSGENIV